MPAGLEWSKNKFINFGLLYIGITLTLVSFFELVMFLGLKLIAGTTMLSKILLQGPSRISKTGLKSIFETDFKRHSEPRLPSTAQINH